MSVVEDAIGELERDFDRHICLAGGSRSNAAVSRCQISFGGGNVAVKFHRCSSLWAKSERHPCWRVQVALDDSGVDYEILKEPPLLRWRRKAVIAGTGAGKLPAIQREDGTWYRKESEEMAREIREGLFKTSDEPAAEAPPSD